MLDRTIAPPVGQIEKINIPQFSNRNLKNGVPIYFLNSGKQEVLKIDIVLGAGVKYEPKPGISFLVSRMLTGGTDSKNAADIATELDYYGAFMDASSSFDHISVSIYCLTKFLEPVMSLLEELLTRSAFPQDQLDTIVRQKSNELAISEKKDSQVGAKRFRQNLFGLSHPYGKILTAEALQQVTRDELVDFYQNVFLNDPVVIISGKADDSAVEVLSRSLEGLQLHQVAAREGVVAPLSQTEVLSRESSVQSSVKMGKLIIGRHHEDIHKLHITTSLLGGYFGSRLMRNIREDKGYTYGIGASVAHLLDASFLMISTDVVKQYTADTYSEIKKEINLLRDELVGEDELQVLKNYLSGKFLSGVDTAFNIAGKFRSVKLHQLDYSYYNDFLSTINHMTPADVQETAQKYFDTEEMSLVIVGGEL